MKKLFTALMCVCLALAGAGCGAAPNKAELDVTIPSGDVIITAPSEPFHSEQLQQPMHAIVMPTVSQDTLADDGTVLFTRSYQRIQLILNGSDVETVIASDLEKRMNSTLSGSAEIESFAREDYTDPEFWTPYFTDISYTPTRIDQSVLSLFCNYSSFSGGIHPSLVTESVTYDLSTGNSLKLGDILIDSYSGADLSTLISSILAPVSDELYYDYETYLQDIFSVNLNNISNWYFSRTGLCFHFEPYEIAPYSSGTITATIPYGDLNGILREQYLPEELPEATGSMYAEAFLADDVERFTFLAEVELNTNGTEILLHPDATVTDVRIETGIWYADGSRYIPVSTVFAADSVGLGNGILITADLSEDAPVLRLVYSSGGQEVSAFIVYDEAGDAILLAHG